MKLLMRTALKLSRPCNFTASQNQSSLNSITCSIWAVRPGTQHVKLRGNRGGMASRIKLLISTAQSYHGPAISQHRKSYPNPRRVLPEIRSGRIGNRGPRRIPLEGLPACASRLPSSTVGALSPPLEPLRPCPPCLCDLLTSRRL